LEGETLTVNQTNCCSVSGKRRVCIKRREIRGKVLSFKKNYFLILRYRILVPLHTYRGGKGRFEKSLGIDRSKIRREIHKGG